MPASFACCAHRFQRCNQCIIHVSFLRCCREAHLINTKAIILTLKPVKFGTIMFSHLLCGRQMVMQTVTEVLACHTWSCWLTVSMFFPFGGLDFSVLGIRPTGMSSGCFSLNRRRFFFCSCEEIFLTVAKYQDADKSVCAMGSVWQQTES